MVVGRVAQWGRTILHKEGARSEYAYPSELFMPSHWRGRSLEPEARELEELYGVSVETLDPKLMGAFGTNEWDVLRDEETLRDPRPWREVLGEAPSG